MTILVISSDEDGISTLICENFSDFLDKYFGSSNMEEFEEEYSDTKFFEMIYEIRQKPFSSGFVYKNGNTMFQFFRLGAMLPLRLNEVKVVREYEFNDA